MTTQYTCHVCGIRTKLTCSACHSVTYCGTTCQRKDWNRHRRRCSRGVGVHYDASPHTHRMTKLSDMKLEVRNFKLLSTARELGRGSYGVVSTHNLSPTDTVAIKQMFRVDTGFISIDAVHEMELVNFNDPNILGICAAGFMAPTDAQPKKSFMVGLDMAHETLYDLIDKGMAEGMDTPFRPIETKFLVYQVIRAISKLHEELTVHLDIKPENFVVFAETIPDSRPEQKNLLLDTTFKCVAIGDFGMSMGLVYRPIVRMAKYTRMFEPPESLLGNTLTTFAGDVWATGCTIFEIMTGERLADGYNTNDQIAKIMKIFGKKAFQDVNPIWLPNFRSDAWADAVDDSKSTFTRFITDDPTPNPDVIKAVDLLSRMLVVDPERRCTMAEALDHPYFSNMDQKLFGPLFGNISSDTGIGKFSYNRSTFEVDRRYAMAHLRRRESRMTTMVSAELFDPRFASITDFVAKVYDKAANTMFARFALEFRICAILRTFLKSGRAKMIDSTNIGRLVYCAAGLANRYLMQNNLSDPKASTKEELLKSSQLQEDIFSVLDFDVTFPTVFEYTDIITADMADLRLAARIWILVRNVVVGEFLNPFHITPILDKFGIFGTAAVCAQVIVGGHVETYTTSLPTYELNAEDLDKYTSILTSLPEIIP